MLVEKLKQHRLTGESNKIQGNLGYLFQQNMEHAKQKFEGKTCRSLAPTDRHSTKTSRSFVEDIPICSKLKFSPVPTLVVQQVELSLVIYTWLNYITLVIISVILILNITRVLV